MLEVPYEEVGYQDTVDVLYVDVERVVEHIVRKEVPGLLFVVTKSHNFGFCHSADLFIFRFSRVE